MISGNKRDNITMNSILEKVSEYDIYKHYVGDFDLGKNFKSPFRNDSSPSFCIDAFHNGRLRHKDFGDESYTGTCVNLVMQLFNLNYSQALEKIYKDMN